MFTSTVLCLHFFLTCSIAGICYIGDRLLYSTEGLAKAFADNVTHGTVSLISGLLVLLGFRSMSFSELEKGLLILMSYAFGAGIDVDHFIEARSLHIHVSPVVSFKCLS